MSAVDPDWRFKGGGKNATSRLKLSEYLNQFLCVAFEFQIPS